MPGLKQAIENGSRRKEEFSHIDFSGQVLLDLLGDQKLGELDFLEQAQYILQGYLITTKTKGEHYENNHSKI